MVLSACVLALGCSGGEGSSEGKTWFLVICFPRDQPSSEQVKIATKRLLETTTEFTDVEKYENGPLLAGGPGNADQSYFLFITLNKPTAVSVRNLSRDLFQEGFHAVTRQFLNIHDVTPHARGSAHGQLRRLVIFPVDIKDTERIQNLENAMKKLPSSIPAIQRFQWAAARENDVTKNRVDWCVVATFKDAAGRNEYLADPAYKEFEQLHKNGIVYEYIVD